VSVRNANSQSVDGTTGKVADVPIAPTSVAGTDVGTSRAYNNGAVSVAFTPDTTYWPATSFTATSNPGGFTATGAASPLVVTGLNSQTGYTFTVTGTNSAATSAVSSASASVTATTVPQTPTIGTVTRVSDSSVSLPFTGNTGGKNLSAVTITSSPALSLSYSGTTSPVAVSATYVYGTDYTFTMTATNANGTSSTSSASNTISPNLTIPNSYESIATYTLGSNQSSITFGSIPSTYKHLQIRCVSKADGAGNGYSLVVAANGDATVANYRSHYLEGNGSSATAGTYQSVGGAYFVGGSTGAGTNSDWFGATIVDILDYKETTKNKTFRGYTGHNRNDNGNIHLSSAVWLNTGAITSLTISIAGANMVSKSQFALYGIKG
jgi:hypothetical protein